MAHASEVERPTGKTFGEERPARAKQDAAAPSSSMLPPEIEADTRSMEITSASATSETEGTSVSEEDGTSVMAESSNRPISSRERARLRQKERAELRRGGPRRISAEPTATEGAEGTEQPSQTGVVNPSTIMLEDASAAPGISPSGPFEETRTGEQRRMDPIQQRLAQQQMQRERRGETHDAREQGRGESAGDQGRSEQSRADREGRGERGRSDRGQQERREGRQMREPRPEREDIRLAEARTGEARSAESRGADSRSIEGRSTEIRTGDGRSMNESSAPGAQASPREPRLREERHREEHSREERPREERLRERREGGEERRDSRQREERRGEERRGQERRTEERSGEERRGDRSERSPREQRTGAESRGVLSELKGGAPKQSEKTFEAAKNLASKLGVSVVVPLYNEQESLRELTAALKQTLLRLAGPRYEIIYVNDGSTDRSGEILSDILATSSRVTALTFRRNMGKSAGLAAGFAEAQYGIVITMDADLQDDPRELPNLIAKLAEGYDLVSGWKKKRYDPVTKTGPSKFFNSVTSFFSGIKLHDFNCGLKAYRKEVTDRLNVYGEMHRYLPALAHWQGFRVAEIPVVHHPRKFGKSKFGSSRFFKGFLDLLSIVFTNRYGKRPLHLFGTVGTLLAIVGVIIDLWVSVEWLLGKTALSNRPILQLGVLLILVGVQLISLGLLGEMIVKNTNAMSNVSVIREKGRRSSEERERRVSRQGRVGGRPGRSAGPTSPGGTSPGGTSAGTSTERRPIKR